MTVVSTINVAACLAIACAITWAIMSPSVQDGLVIKLGLICCALGFVGTAASIADDRMWALNNALLLIHGGAIVVAGGYWLRQRKRARLHRRRKSDRSHLRSVGAA